MGGQKQALLARLQNVRADLAGRTSDAKQNVAQSVGNSLQAFGSNPQAIGNEMENPAYQGYEPALQQLQNRAMGQVGAVGSQMAQQVGRQEQDVQAEYADYMQRLEGWRKEKEAEAISHYQQQRMAIERERGGSQLERQLMLANLAASLQGGLNNINSAYSVAAKGA